MKLRPKYSFPSVVDELAEGLENGTIAISSDTASDSLYETHGAGELASEIGDATSENIIGLKASHREDTPNEDSAGNPEYQMTAAFPATRRVAVIDPEDQMVAAMSGNLSTLLVTTDFVSEFAADVFAGLSKKNNKSIPSKYLYDDVGSALSEVISHLPEYGLTRADEGLLREHASDIVNCLPARVEVAELGSGSGKKTRCILEALCRKQRTSYYPIEISHSSLAMLGRQLEDIDSINIVGLELEYLNGLAEVAARRRSGSQLLVLFLGSTIGNFDRQTGISFLRDIRRILSSGDSLLLGTDLEKPVNKLIQARDDELGVNAAFNLNLLARINRELGADFNLDEFEHVTRYNLEEHSVEMHIRSKRSQVVRVSNIDLAAKFAAGETILTEINRVYSAKEPLELAQQAGFRCVRQWIDKSWLFAENLFIAE